MARRQIYVAGVGQVTMAKRRGNANLRLSIKPGGQVYLSMPRWTPYIAGERFIVSRSSWIQEQLQKNSLRPLKHGDQIGKNHRLHFNQTPSEVIKTKLGQTTIEVASRHQPDHHLVQQKALAACEKALRMQSEALVSIRLDQLSRDHGLPFQELRIRKLTSRWGSCSSKDAITISIYLIQLPWELIDYVLLHELVHTKFMNHSRQFWIFFESLSPGAKARQKQIRAYSPRVEAV